MRGAATRRGVLASLAAGLAGCLGGGDSGGTETMDDNPALGEVTPRGDLSLSSPAFDDGGRIPDEYGRGERNVNPPLSVGSVPGGAASLVLILDDPDAPGGVFLHWLVWNIDPERTAIPEGWDPESAIEGRNGFGNRGYGGPSPPSPHRYRFKLFALDRALDLSASATKAAVGRAMDGAVLAATQLDGRYVP